MGGRKAVAPEIRFWRHVVKGPDCWEWRGSDNGHGYGTFAERTTGPAGFTYAHRFAYKLLVGPIPEGLTIDHLCSNRACVRPDHLEAVSIQENLRRGNSPASVNRRKTHCYRGHEFNDTNTYPYKGKRECRQCRREYNRQYRRASRSKAKH